jgi:Mrp family chromosome partitioning ATPase/uncharacterized protein involved in exopolysaccharide biosynthesis
MTSESPELQESPAARRNGAGHQESLFDLLEWRRVASVRLIWIMLLVFPLLGGVINLRLLRGAPEYEAVGRMLLVRGGGNKSVKKRDFGDEAAVMGTAQFQQAVLDQMTPSERLLLGKHHRVKNAGASAGAKTRTALVGGVTVTRDGETTLMNVTCDSPDPNLAAALVNATIRTAEQYGARQAIERTTMYRSFFDPRMQDLQDQIASQQEQERKLGATLPLDVTLESGTGVARLAKVGTGDTGSGADSSDDGRAGGKALDSQTQEPQVQGPDEAALGVTESAALQAGLDLRLDQARLRLDRVLGSEAPDLSTRGGDERASQLTGLRNQLSQAEATYASLNVTMGENNPTLRTHVAQIENIRRQLDAFQQNGLAGAQARVNIAGAISNRLASAAHAERDQVTKTLDARQQAALLEARLAINLTLQADLATSLANLPTQAVMDGLTAEVVDFAQAPLGPLREAPRRLFLWGCVIGVAFAFFVIVMQTLYHQSRWTLNQIENAASAPVATITRRTKDSPRQTGQALERSLRDELESLRVALPLMRATQTNAVLLFTSTLPGEGTTTLASEFARTLARAGHRVLLIDANLFRPGVKSYFHLQQPQGLTSVLYGAATLAEAVQVVAAPGTANDDRSLDVLSSGPPVPDPAKALHGTAMSDLLAHARSTYRYVVVDTAPSSAPKGILSGASVDMVFLVARLGRARLDQVRRARTRLVSVGLIPNAVLVNAVRPGWNWRRLLPFLNRSPA